MNKSYIDIHCHPSLKPYGKSFKYQPQKQNRLNTGRKNSIWHYSPPNFLERHVNLLLTLTKFTQTDLTALAKTDCNIVIISLYPFEKHFLKDRMLGFKFIPDLLVNLAAGVSQKRIDNLRNHSSYFQDLNDEYNYYMQLHNMAQIIDDVTFTYRLVSSYSEITNNIKTSTAKRKIISLVPSIEGAHAFETGLDKDKDTADEATVLQHIETVKKWDHKPFFVTLAHHFYNEICGHARSISIGLIEKEQNRGLNTDITELGFKVIDKLLDNSDNKRILIDVKHMSTAARKTYYKLLETKYINENIPIIVSHGALNGKRSIEEWKISDSKLSENFSDVDINFYDSEIVRIAKSKGLFGLQLDERRIGSKKAIRSSRVYWPNTKRRYENKSQLIWNQIQRIGEILDENGLFCWETVAIGSDFDGIINPIKGLWTAENIKDIKPYLIKNAENYLKSNASKLQTQNQISAEEIIDRLLFINADAFLKRNFN
ncbi:membrane dipeptidase (peptidase family M19) [Winogradskyella pacifica]|uniref:Membrane dipeptidase (Peptidase family M19) n=1 Tax=Winogradskyella pacifica TaxID=664642 RepID=A0A3D9N3P7_9FLAO|nr:membrane dipeptidase [Winogradskyella pacifica]REE27581.1 membrane dipeptidase (peptidase family M19) [Winogradskyella pacifica]